MFTTVVLTVTLAVRLTKLNCTYPPEAGASRRVRVWFVAGANTAVTVPVPLTTSLEKANPGRVT